MVEHTEYYENEVADTKWKDSTYKGRIFDAMSKATLGTLVIRPIVDKRKIKKNGKEYPRLNRRVDNGILGEIIDVKNTPKNEDGTLNLDKAQYVYFSMPDIKNFEDAGTVLTDKQKRLFAKVRRYLYALKEGYFQWSSIEKNEFPDIYKLLPRMDFKRQIVMFYGKLLDRADVNRKRIDDATIGHVRVFCFSKGQIGSSDFITVNKKAIENKATVLEGKEWLNDYYCAVPGMYDKVMVTNTSKAEPENENEYGKYSLAISYESGKIYELSEEDISLVGNLDDNRYCCSKFDDEIYEKVKDGLIYVSETIKRKGLKPVPKQKK